MTTVWRFYSSLIDYTKSSNRLNKLVSNYWLSELDLCHCAFELQQKTFCDKIMEIRNGSFIFQDSLTPADLLAMEYVIVSLPIV